MATFRFTFRVETFIEANNIEEASAKYDGKDLNLPEGIDFVETVSVENADTHEDLTEEYFMCD